MVRLLLICIPIVVLFLTACSATDTEPQDNERRPNVILISIDTLRPDHLGCYGYEKATSPALDLLCEDAVVFEEAIAHASSTLHSHASMLTSLLPHHHQATWSAKTRIPEDAICLAEVLQQAGYRTAAFTGGGQMDRVFGLDQGFEVFEQPMLEHFEDTMWKGVEWVESDDSRPFFLFLHSYEVHHPYTPEADYLALFEDGYSGSLPGEISLELLGQINNEEIDFDEADLGHVVAAYDAEIRSADDGVSHLIRYLREKGLYDDTLVVFTSDHGEEFGEHGLVGVHSHTLFDELLRVPLVIKFPGSAHAGTRVGYQVRGIDIPPTVVSAVGIAIPEVFSGTDLRSLLATEQVGDLVAISRLDRPPGRGGTTSARVMDWKLIEEDLFDLSYDPGETWYAHPIGEGVEAAERLRIALDEALASHEPYPTEVVAPAESTVDELRALGYIQ